MSDREPVELDLGTVTSYGLARENGFAGSNTAWVKKIMANATEEDVEAVDAKVDALDTKVDTQVETINATIEQVGAVDTKADGIAANLTTLSGVVARKMDTDDAEASFVPVPTASGAQGDALRNNGDGTTAWAPIGLPTDEQTGTAINAWLTAHPEATTTVQDGAITRAKLDAGLQEKTDMVLDLKSAVTVLKPIEKSYPESFFDTEEITNTVTYTRESINYDGTISGSTTRLASNFIPLGNKITIHNDDTSTETGMQYWIRVYNANKEFIANAQFTGENTCVVGTGSSYGLTAVSNVNIDNIISVQSDAAYIRLSIRYMATSATTILPSDVDFEYTGKVFKGGSLDDYFVHSVAPENTTFFDISTNLYDGHTLETGRLVTGGTVDSTKTGFQTTGYIDIHGNAGKYIMAENIAGSIGYYGVGFYNADKVFISGNGSTSVAAIQIPNNAYYVRMTIANGSNVFPFIGINSTSSAIPYEPYYKYIKSGNLNAAGKNWYKGKTIAALGDSITENGGTVADTHSGWRTYVYNSLILASPVVNNGIGGTRVSGGGENAMWQDARINAISTDSDVVLFNGGMNDWGGNAPIGTIDSTDTDTFMGALNVVAQKLLTRFPNTRIFWMTTTYGRNNNDVTPDLNGLNLTTRDYAEAIRTVAKKYGFPVIDLSAECGWNEINYADYLNAESGIYIHPNRTGGKRIAEVIIGRLLQFQKIE